MYSATSVANQLVSGAARSAAILAARQEENVMSDYQNMQAKIQYLAQELKTAQQARLRALYSDWQADREDVKVVPGAKYTKVDVGFDSAEPGGIGQWQGKLMVEHETGNIYGIKAYGKVHKGHQYGTLETVDDWDWGDYYPKAKPAVDHNVCGVCGNGALAVHGNHSFKAKEVSV